MVDTQDLKSCDHYGCAGSSPAPGTESLDLSGLSSFSRCKSGANFYFVKTLN